MEWARLLAQELLLRNEYLAAENWILRGQLKGRLRLSDGERATLGKIGPRLCRKAAWAARRGQRSWRTRPTKRCTVRSSTSWAPCIESTYLSGVGKPDALAPMVHFAAPPDRSAGRARS